MKTVVLDTSALIRLYVPDGPLPEGLEEHIALAWRAEAVVIIPELALVEAAQVLWKKESAGYLESSEVDEIFTCILELPLEIIGHYALLPDVFSLVRQHQLTAYDALFLVLAQKRKAELITADQKLLKVFQNIS
jgi:predicted nucleic acid-binding protein